MKNLNLRLEDGLHSRLKHLAKRDRRSLQQEIVFLLDFAYDAFDDKDRAERAKEASDGN